MKKSFSFFVLLGFIAAIVSCKRTNFIIRGSISTAKDGDTVFLQQRRGNVLETVDTSLIRDGKFFFTGYEDSVAPRAITYANNEDDYFVPFVLEPGDITIELQESFKVGGTPHNDLLQNYYSRLNTYQEQLNFFTHRLPPYTYLNKNSALIIAKINKLKTNCNELVFNTIRENINNPVSIILLLRDNYLLNSLQVEELTSMLPEKTRSLPKIKNLQKNSIEDNNTALGKVFIDFSMPNMNKQNVTLKDIVRTHQLTFVDFWASWCVPCCKELPEIERLYKKYKKYNLTIIGVSLDTDYNKWHSTVYKYRLTYPQLSDLKGFQSEVAKQYYIRSLPLNYLINRNGTIIGKNIPANVLENTLENEFRTLQKLKK